MCSSDLAALGDQPAHHVHDLAQDAISAVLGASLADLVTSAAGGIRFGHWLPTRIFELGVHTLDIAGALGRMGEFLLPDAVIADAAALAARVAAATGRGQNVLLALTGRGHLPDGFSVV